jgi:hypothetical protein
MSRLEQLDQQFRTLHRAAHDEYTENITRAHAEHDFRASRNKGREEHERKALYRITQISANEYARADREREKGSKEHAKRVRAQFVERKSKEPESSRRRAVLGHGAPNLQSIPLYATSVMSGDKTEVADIAGERGNPWVLPWNPDQVKLSQFIASNEYGLCGWARAYRPPLVVDFWFAFLADTTAVWNFLAIVDSFGFYLLNTNSGFWLCRFSKVTVDASLNMYQYFWFGEKKFSILSQESDDGFRSGFVDEYGLYDYQAFLRADPDAYVFLRVRMTISADAYGSGTWAEINFKDGDANYIKPILLVANPF